MKFYLHCTSDFSSWLSQPATFLFNDRNHLLLQSKKGWHVFEFRESKTDKTSARISFNIKSGEAQSPLHAPFGSVEVYRKMKDIQLKEFLEKVQSELMSMGVTKIIIRNFPDLYDEHLSQTVSQTMRSLRFSCREEISSIIQVDEKAFERKIKASERQKLKKATALFQIDRVGVSDLKLIYSFIADCRKERNQSLSMTLLELNKTISVYPEQFYFFKTIRNNEIAAAAIVIQISKDVLYTFYYAHAKKHNRVSPVVFLISSIYEFATVNKFNMIDLGTSMIDGHINQSLLHFKKSIGGVSCSKFTYTRSL
ncbi:MAG: hypothetical protein ABL895_12300 [Cyclobacteriaceae bacterium]